MHRKSFLWLTLVSALVLTPGLHAQTSKKSDATIAGTVYDADGKPVAGAAVTCQSSAGIRPRVVHTDAKGRYHITGLKQDNYDLRAGALGAYSDWEKNVFVRKGEKKEFTFHLLNGNTVISGIVPAKQKK